MVLPTATEGAIEGDVGVGAVELGGNKALLDAEFSTLGIQDGVHIDDACAVFLTCQCGG